MAEAAFLREHLLPFYERPGTVITEDHANGSERVNQSLTHHIVCNPEDRNAFRCPAARLELHCRRPAFKAMLAWDTGTGAFERLRVGGP
jgi:hypothetical protein